MSPDSLDELQQLEVVASEEGVLVDYLPLLPKTADLRETIKIELSDEAGKIGGQVVFSKAIASEHIAIDDDELVAVI